MAQERDSNGRFKSKSDSGDSGGGSRPTTSYKDKKKIPDAPPAVDSLDDLQPPREGLSEDEAVTRLEEVMPEGVESFEDGVTADEYRPEESFDGDPEALREAMERLREDGSVDAAAEALEEMDLDALEGDTGSEDAGEAGEEGESIPWEALSEKLGVEADAISVTVKVNGEDQEVPLSEALNGYTRQADYTRKTQQLAERRQELEGALEASAVRLQALDNIFAQAMTPQQLQQVGAAYQRVLAERAALEAHHLETEVLPAEHKALADALGWESEDDVSEGKARLAEAAISQGFDPDDLSNVTDHPLLVLLDKAARYDEMQAQMEDSKASARSKRRKGRNLKPGTTGSQKRRPSKLSEARQRVRRTGRVEDAAAALDSILPGDDELGI